MAQLVARLVRIEKARGSSPLTSTSEGRSDRAGLLPFLRSSVGDSPDVWDARHCSYGAPVAWCRPRVGWSHDEAGTDHAARGGASVTLQIRRAEEHVVRRWRNGGGQTTEVLASPEGADAGSVFDWRISFAEVPGSGDFSLFPGVDRVITLLEGGSMTLQVGGEQVELEPFRPVAFDGGVPVSCAVGSPTRDLNVMTRRGRATAAVEVLDLMASGPGIALSPGEPLLVVALTGEVSVAAAAASAHLQPDDVVATAEAVTVAGSGRCAVVRISLAEGCAREDGGAPGHAPGGRAS